jgi:hypothetical protein
MNLQSKLAAARAAIREGHRVSILGVYGIALLERSRNIGDVERALNLNPHGAIRVDEAAPVVPAPKPKAAEVEAPRRKPQTKKVVPAEPVVEAVEEALAEAPIAAEPTFDELLAAAVEVNQIAAAAALAGAVIAEESAQSAILEDPSIAAPRPRKTLKIVKKNAAA